MYIDKFGCMVTKDLDGGDSLRFTAFHEILYRFTGKHAPPAELLVNQLELFHVGLGIWRRHPDTSKWYSNPNNVSRDQLIATLRALAMSGKIGLMLLTYLRIVLRLGFAQNTHRNYGQPGWKLPDWMGFGATEAVLRGIGAKNGLLSALVYLPLLCFDLLQVFAALGKCFAPVWKDNEHKFEWANNPDETDDENFISYHLHAIKQVPTVFSWLSRRIYSIFRPSNYGVTKLGYKNNVLGARAWYGERDTPELTDLFEEVAYQYFSK